MEHQHLANVSVVALMMPNPVELSRVHRRSWWRLPMTVPLPLSKWQAAHGSMFPVALCSFGRIKEAELNGDRWTLPAMRRGSSGWHGPVSPPRPGIPSSEDLPLLAPEFGRIDLRWQRMHLGPRARLGLEPQHWVLAAGPEELAMLLDPDVDVPAFRPVYQQPVVMKP